MAASPISAPLPQPRPPRPADSPAGGTARDPALWAAAQKMEAAFLAEMLKGAGLDAARGGPGGGGAGEEQFSSFLREEHARALVARGGLGLSESLYHALKERQDGE